MLPILYHAHHSLRQDDLSFWLKLCRESPGAILEIGCGTGRITLPLARTGKPVFGLDIDFAMLKYLKSRLAEESPTQVVVFQADFTAFHLAARFGLIVLACNTYSTLAADQRRATLRCVLEHLQPVGLFAFSVPNPYQLVKMHALGEAELEDIFPHPKDGEPVQVSSEWTRTKQDLVVQWHYDHLHPNGQVDRVTARLVHHLTSVEEYRTELTAAGFKDLLLFGDFDRSTFSPASPYLILLASA